MRAASTAAFFALSTPTQATGTPGRHLHDREQRVEPVEHALRRAQRDADHRQVGVRGDDARQRGGEAGAADQDAQPTVARRLRVLGDRVRGAVGRAHLELVRDPARVELVHRGLHPLAVGLGADEDPDDAGQPTRLVSGQGDVGAVARAGERDRGPRPRTPARALRSSSSATPVTPRILPPFVTSCSPLPRGARCGRRARRDARRPRSPRSASRCRCAPGTRRRRRSPSRPPAGRR